MISKAHWVIDNCRDDSDTPDLVKAIEKSGRTYQVLKGKDVWELSPEHFKEIGWRPIIAIGSIQFINQVQTYFPSVHCWNTKNSYLCSNYYKYFDGLLFNDRHSLIPAGELTRNKWLYFGHYSKEAVVFLRPDDGDKSFKGGPFDLQYFDKDWAKIKQNLHDSDLVLISTPKNIKGEFRFICIEDRIVASSTYIYGGQRTLIPSVPPEALEKCKEVLKRGYFPDPVFSVDICQDGDGQMWLLELNSFSSCGLYACDKDVIVKEVSELVEKES